MKLLFVVHHVTNHHHFVLSTSGDVNGAGAEMHGVILLPFHNRLGKPREMRVSQT